MPVEGAVWSWELESCSNEKKSYVCVCVRVCVQQKTKQKKDLQMDNGSTGDKKKMGRPTQAYPWLRPCGKVMGLGPPRGLCLPLRPWLKALMLL